MSVSSGFIVVVAALMVVVGRGSRVRLARFNLVTFENGLNQAEFAGHETEFYRTVVLPVGHRSINTRKREWQIQRLTQC